MTTKTKENLTYRTVGDFRIPNLTLLPEEANITLGKWGMLYKNYLLNHEKVVFSTFLAEGKLYQHCAEIENQARNMLDTLVEQMKVSEGVTEHLKEQDQLEWVPKKDHVDSNEDYICDTEGCGFKFEVPKPACDYNCHKDGIAAFFFNFILFFQKLFKANQICACGEAHY